MNYGNPGFATSGKTSPRWNPFVFMPSERLYSSNPILRAVKLLVLITKTPPLSIMNTPYEIKFILRHISDPYRTFAWTLMLYRARNHAPGDSLNAYTGILNRIAHSLPIKTLCGNPVSILKVTLIWYNKPDSAKLNEQRPVRAPHQPSWSWTAWTKCPAVTFLPPGGPNARRDWIDSRTNQLHFYYTHHDGTGFKRLQNGAPIRNTPPVPAMLSCWSTA